MIHGMMRAWVMCVAVIGGWPARAEITRIWLTHQQAQPTSLTVNWETAAPGDSVVEYGSTEALGERTTGKHDGPVTLHHVEVPLTDTKPIHYRVRSGQEASAIFRTRGYDSDVLKVAVVADTGYARGPWMPAVTKEAPHLLLAAGDIVSSVHGKPGEDPLRNTRPFSALIDAGPELFRSTPFMPALGNHDREIRPRTDKPPVDAVYDVEATGFRSFFPLPGKQWIWHFDLPAFGVRFAALDMSHLQDHGTTWQTNHDFDRESEQFKWYADLVARSDQPFFITIYNEQNSKVRSLEKGEWAKLISKGSLAITGFGYFAERAQTPDGFTWYNTSVSGRGAKYADKHSALLKSEDNYLLLSFDRQKKLLTVEIKSTSGEVLDSKEFKPRG